MLDGNIESKSEGSSEVTDKIAAESKDIMDAGPMFLVVDEVVVAAAAAHSSALRQWWWAWRRSMM